MLLVETYIDNSPGKGLGLFAKNRISKGEKYWIRNESFDRVFVPAQMQSFEKLTSDYIQLFGFQEENGNWYLCGDHAKFSNHSSSPNSKSHFDSNGLVMFNTAVRDIEAGEEILCDYVEICATCEEGVNFNEILR